MLTITINTDNEAFDEPGKGEEIARILEEVADDFRATGGSFARADLRDINGNGCGTVHITSSIIPEGPYALHYSTGGHGGPYQTYSAARSMAKRMLAGSQWEHHIDIDIVLARDFSVIVRRLFQDGSEGLPLEGFPS